MRDRLPDQFCRTRAAIVGAGLMGRWHADAIRHIGGEVYVIADPDSQKRERLRRRHPKAKVTADLASIAADHLADVVHICTPPETHESLTRQALEAGLHALVEKPVSETGEATLNLLRLAESRGLLLCPVHQYLFQTGVLRLQKALQKIGPLHHLDTMICSAGAELSSVNADRVAAEILPGSLALIARLLLKPIGSANWEVQHPTAGELRSSTSVGGVCVSVLISMSGRPTTNALRFIGERGTAHVDLFHGFSIIEQGPVSRARKIAHPFAHAGTMIYAATTNLLSRAIRFEPAYPGLRELIRRFYHAIRTGGTSPISVAETLDIALARDRIQAAMQEKIRDSRS